MAVSHGTRQRTVALVVSLLHQAGRAEAARDAVSLEVQGHDAWLGYSYDNCEKKPLPKDACCWDTMFQVSGWDHCVCCGDKGSEWTFLDTCTSMHKCLMEKPQDPPSPWSREKEWCYAPKDYWEYHICRKDWQKVSHTRMGDITHERAQTEVPPPIVSQDEGIDQKYDQKYKFLDRPEGPGEKLSKFLDSSSKNAAYIGALFIFPGATIVLGWLMEGVKIFSQDQPLKLDLTQQFKRFKDHVDQTIFNRLVEELRAKHSLFKAWFHDLMSLSKEADTVALERLIMRCEMLDKDMKVAMTSFGLSILQSKGAASYFLLNAFFDFAYLHVQVLLLHSTALLSSSMQHGDTGDQEAGKREHGRAAAKLDQALKEFEEYRSRLDALNSNALKWRLSLVTAHGKTLTDKSFCRQTEAETEIPDPSLEGLDWEVQYNWKDTFFGDAAHDFSETTKLRFKYNLVTSRTTCILEGIPPDDGRSMLQQAKNYKEELRKMHVERYDFILRLLDQQRLGIGATNKSLEEVARTRAWD